MRKNKFEHAYVAIKTLVVIAGVGTLSSTGIGIAHAAPNAQDPSLYALDASQVTTFVGTVAGKDNVSKTASGVTLDFPQDIALDTRNGDMYIADTMNNEIRRVTGGNITTFAGTGSYGDTNGARTTSELAQPNGVTISPAGDIFIADTLNNKIKKVHLGLVTTLASGLSKPEGVTVSGSRLYIADTGNHAIKYVDVNGGNVQTLASGSLLGTPKKMTLASGGSMLYVADAGTHRLVEINTTTGAQTSLAGDGTSHYQEGTGTGAGFQNLWGVARVGSTLYVSDGNGFTDRVRTINSSTGQTSLLTSDAGMVELNFPAGLIADGPSLFVTNSGLGTIRQVRISDGFDQGIYAGTDRFGNVDGSGASANIGRPYDIAVAKDNSNYLYLAENNKISEIAVATATRTALWGNSIDNYKEDTGSVGRASTISSLAVSNDRNTIYFVDTFNNRIRKVDRATKTSSLISGGGNINTTGPGNGYVEAAGTAARFDNPRGMAISPDNNWLYISDTSNLRIRKVRISDGQTFFIAGSGAAGYTDATGSQATFNRPMGLAVDSTNTNLYLADSMNHVIRQIRISDGQTSTVAGAGRIGYRDGVGTNAVFAIPEYVEYVNGFLYVSEAGSQRIRKINLATKEVTTVAGSGARGYKNDTVLASEFNNLKGLVVVGANAYVADSWNDVIRKIPVTASAPSTGDQVASGSNFFAYDSALRGGFYGASCDLTGDGKREIISGTSVGLGPQVRVFDSEGNVLFQFFAYASTLRSGVRVACGDVNGDGKNDIVTAPGPGGAPHIRIFSNTGALLAPGFFALNGTFTGGTNVAVGDVDGDGKAEIIVSASKGGGPQITVHDYLGHFKGNFMAYDPALRTGVRVATADVDGDGVKEIVTGPETGAPQIQVFRKSGQKVSPGFFAYDQSFRGGVSVAGGDVNGDGKDEILVGEGTTGQPFQSTVKMFDRFGNMALQPIKAYAPSFTGGVNVFSGDTDNDGKDEVLVLPMSAGSPNVRIINPDEQ